MRNIFIGLLLSVTAAQYGCQSERPLLSSTELESLVAQLLEKNRDNMVFIEGGTFVMGDFGAVGEDGVWRPYFPPTIEQDQPHDVTLSSYSLSSHKTKWADFDTYLLANDLPFIVQGLTKDWERSPYDQDPSSDRYVEKPARVTWQQAKDYCLWVGEQAGYRFDLPTSAQWEFAGRNRGSKAWVFSTHDGRHRGADPELAKRLYDTGIYVPVGSRLPPNPLGLFDMADNGKEWVNDWYSETYYGENPSITDPQGPDEGVDKVVRNLDFSFSRIGMPESLPSAFNEEWDSVSEFTFRCAVQSTTPVSN